MNICIYTGAGNYWGFKLSRFYCIYAGSIGQPFSKRRLHDQRIFNNAFNEKIEAYMGCFPYAHWGLQVSCLVLHISFTTL